MIPQPFPYQGSKRKIAKEILKFFPKETIRVVEPFSGSAAISIAAAYNKKVKRFLINDKNEPLINLLKMIVSNPEFISLEYKKLWENQKGREKIFYEEIRDKFNETKKPEYLLFLLARCVKGSVRYNSQRLFNQSPDNRRMGMHPKKMRTNIIAISRLLKNKTEFTSMDYNQIINHLKEGDIIYMDPPYQGVCSRRDSRYSFSINYEQFIKFLEKLNKKGALFIVSYDGRTGNKIHGKTLPDYLRLHLFEINAGKSSQSTLLGKKEITYESLYISKNLFELVKHNIYKDNLIDIYCEQANSKEIYKKVEENQGETCECCN